MTKPPKKEKAHGGQVARDRVTATIVRAPPPGKGKKVKIAVPVSMSVTKEM